MNGQMRYLVAEVSQATDTEPEHFFCAWIIEYPHIFVWGDTEDSALTQLEQASIYYFSKSYHIKH